LRIADLSTGAQEPEQSSPNAIKLGGWAKRPIDKKLGGWAKRPIDKKWGEQAKRPIDKKWGEQAKRPIDKKLLRAIPGTHPSGCLRSESPPPGFDCV
jgi:hypothetical protein